MKVFGLAPNPHKSEAIDLAGELADWLMARGISVLATSDMAEIFGKPQIAATEEEVASTDLLLILGGDGTMLRWSRIAGPKQTPMLGINFGQYGFITEIQPEEIIPAMEDILKGNFSISERVVLKALHWRGDKIIGTYYALNDVVVSKGPLARMLNLHTHIDDKFIVTHAADGLIIASPTGSTAYSLSAGGPIIHPDVSVIVVTPICPHTLSARSLVVPDHETIKIVCECSADSSTMMLTIDGQLGEPMTSDDMVEIKKAEFTAKLVHLEAKSFYNKLQTRLRWGERQ